MNVLGISGSPRKGGNTEILVREALDAIQELGGETELVTVSGKTINPCDGCRACVKEGICHINDDMQEIYQQLLQSDGIMLGTPVYFNNVSAQAKAVMDRLYALFLHLKLRGKVAGAIVVARRVGAGHVRSMLSAYCITPRILEAGGAIGYGREQGEVLEGPGGAPNTSALEEARGLGKAVVLLHQQLSK